MQVRLSFDAFGKRRKEAGWSGSVPAGDWTAIANTSRRAYTEHEAMDNLNLIHMNGRVQDPLVGRFLSADPFVSAPDVGQSFNRYSYVGNNPLSLIDPSGYEPWSVHTSYNGHGVTLGFGAWLFTTNSIGHTKPGQDASGVSHGDLAPSERSGNDLAVAEIDIDERGEITVSIMFPPLDATGRWLWDRYRAGTAPIRQAGEAIEQGAIDFRTQYPFLADHPFVTAVGVAGSAINDNNLDNTLLLASSLLGGELSVLGRGAVEAAAARGLPRLEVSASKYPELAENILHAQRAGHPSVLTHGVNAAANRAAALDGVPNIRGLSRDEYPFASSMQGGGGSWVGHIPASQQQAQGGLITDFLRRFGIEAGDQYEVVVVP